MAEWLGIGLQNRVQQFESAWHLQQMPLRLFRGFFLLLTDMWLEEPAAFEQPLPVVKAFPETFHPSSVVTAIAIHTYIAELLKVLFAEIRVYSHCEPDQKFYGSTDAFKILQRFQLFFVFTVDGGKIL